MNCACNKPIVFKTEAVHCLDCDTTYFRDEENNREVIRRQNLIGRSLDPDQLTMREIAKELAEQEPFQLRIYQPEAA